MVVKNAGNPRPCPQWCVEHRDPDPDPMGNIGWSHGGRVTRFPMMLGRTSPPTDTDMCTIDLLAFDLDGQRERFVEVAPPRRNMMTMSVSEARALADALLAALERIDES